MRKRILCILLVLSMLLPLALLQPPKAQAATKKEISRVISIVFDNSGSMYEEKDKPISSWCRATYAMEVFASMLNDSDKLLIYPMHPIQDGKNGPAISAPLVINGPGDAEKIRNIYTPVTGKTPFDPVIEAYEGLSATYGDEKYLIILTDGVFDDDVYKDRNKVVAKLDEFSRNVNVMYLGIGAGAGQPPKVTNPDRQYYQKATDSRQVLSKLTEMCNRIFGRTELKASNNQVSFDVSVGKLILFVQGKNISGVQINGGTKVSERVMKYSDLGRGGHQGGSGFEPDRNMFSVDESLQGMLVTYKDLDAGTYNLSYTGDVTSVSVYYEPDVDLQIKTFFEGVEVDPSKDDLYPGKYTFTYGLVDKDGNPTTSKLLGQAKYKITYTVDGQTKTVNASSNGSFTVDLAAGQELDSNFEVTYLNDYTIRKNGLDLGWPSIKLNIKPHPVGKVELRISGEKSVALSRLEQDGKFSVAVLYEGKILTGSELERVTLDGSIRNGNALYEITRTADGFEVALKYNGSPANTQCGTQRLELTATYTNQDGATGKASDSHKFEIRDDSKGLEAKLQTKQTFFEMSKIDEADPIILNLTSGGNKLTAEQFAATAVDIKLDGVAHEIQPDPANSRYLIILKGENAKAGRYKIQCTASGNDSVGRPVTAQASRRIELQPYPQWLRTTFIVGLIILALVLFFLFMNQKVLPGDIQIDSTEYLLGVKDVPTNADRRYNKKSRKNATLTITPPRTPNTAANGCGIMLNLEADSNRWVFRHEDRTVRVTNATPLSKDITEAEFGANTIVKDPITGQFVTDGKETLEVNTKMKNRSVVKVKAVVPKPNGVGKVSTDLEASLKFCKGRRKFLGLF